jgi:hypothetical protein
MFRLFTFVRISPTIATGSFGFTLTDLTDVRRVTAGFFGSFVHIDKFGTITTNDSSAITGTVPTFVKMILTASTIRKVGNGIIGNTIWTVPNLTTLRTRANKRSHHKPVNVYSPLNPFLV